MTTLVRDLEQDLRKLEDRADELATDVLSSSLVEMFLHVMLVLLFIYLIYLLIRNPNERTVTNYLLLLIAVAVTLQIHQNITVQHKLKV